MSAVGGYVGNILYVDLGTGQSRVEPLPPKYGHDFLGGGGINARLALDVIPKGADPLSAENALIFGSGPFVGTTVPGSGKSNVTYKSPLTGLLGSSGGGHMGTLKFAGYDHLVVQGKAAHPVYLRIRDDVVDILDASDLWGKDTFETTDTLWDRDGSDAMVMATGPAGENLLADANIIVDKCTVYARGGAGAVMGSKNLKAIAIQGTRSIGVADPKRFSKLIREAYKQFQDQPMLEEWRTRGTLISLEIMTKLGVVPARNFQEAATAASSEDFVLDTFLADYKAGDVACMGCLVGCKHYISPKSGPHAGESVTIGCVNSVFQSLAQYCGVRGWDEILRLARICNRMSIDWYSFANSYAMVAELQEKGLIGTEKTDGVRFEWGSADTIALMMDKMIRREGFGEALARGIRGVVERLGEEFAPYANEVKGMGVMLDPRAVLSCDAFSQVVNPKGGHGSMVSFTMLGGPPEKMQGRTRKYGERAGFPADAIERFCDDPLGYNVARLTKWVEDFSYAMDSLGLCSFAMYQRFDMGTWAGLYSALTGQEVSAADLLKGGERTMNAKRAFNLREGATRADDRPPAKFVDQALAVAGAERAPLGRETMERLVSEYYEERGWTPEGTIEAAKRQELGLGV